MSIRKVSMALALALTACAGRPGTAPRETGGVFVIQDVTLVSPERTAPLEHADVVIRDHLIAQVGVGIDTDPQAKRIDGRGRFLVPGLIDSHVHAGSQGPLDDDAIDSHPDLLAAYRAQVPRSYLAFGFTTLVDLDLREGTRAWFESASLHPRLYHCGPAVRIAGGYGAQRVSSDAAAARALNLVYEAAQSGGWPAGLEPRDHSPARAVDRVAEQGGICVKTFIEPGFGGAFHWPIPRPETLAALRAEAHRRGLVFVVHANAVDAWRAALEARADVIAHGLWHWSGDLMDPTPPARALAMVEAAARARVRVQPTLQAVYGDQSIFDWSILDNPLLAETLPRVVVTYLHGDEARTARRALADEYRQAFSRLFVPRTPDAAQAMSIAPARATATLRLMLAQGVKVLLGTDTPSNEGIGNPPGLNGRLEMQRWFEAGASLPLILRAATLDNAAAFGLASQLGTIEVGKRADLLLLRADPLRTIAAYDTIETIILDGQPIPRAALLPSN